jgi:hypothetical protein
MDSYANAMSSSCAYQSLDDVEDQRNCKKILSNSSSRAASTRNDKWKYKVYKAVQVATVNRVSLSKTK